MAEALRYIALAVKGGNVEIGEDRTKSLVHSGRAKLVAVAADASPGAKRRAEGYVFGTNVPLLALPYDKAQISQATGRRGCSMAGFRDLGLAAAFTKALAAEFGEAYQMLADMLTERLAQESRRQRKSGNRRK